MRAIKSRGGLVGGRQRNQDSSHKTWIAMLEQASLVSQTMNEAGSRTKAAKGNHPDTHPSAVKKNMLAFSRAKRWFEERVSFDQEPIVLLSFSTGLFSTEETDKINPDKVLSVGTFIEEKHDNKTFVDPMESKLKVKNLSLLRKPIRISDKQVVFDSLKFFNRAMLITERTGNMTEALKFELTPYPLALFDKQFMLKADKPKLGMYLKKLDAASATRIRGLLPQIIDGGWLLHQISYQSNETFKSIVSKYTGLVGMLGNGQKTVVVLDGYSNISTKDHEHKRRLKNHCANMTLALDTPCTMSKERFLSNGHNKSQLISFISNRLSAKGVDVFGADDDADTLIVSKALEMAAQEPVQIVAEDTDILCMLVHHISTVANDILFRTKTASYSTLVINQNLPENENRVLLFAHAFSGSDTTSRISGFGKVRLLKKLANSHAPANAIGQLLDTSTVKDDVCSAGISLFKYIYGHPSMELHNIRSLIYSKSMAKGKFLPQKLPPTESAAEQHILRVYLQWSDWMLLTTSSLDPTKYGWSRSSGSFEPIGFIGDVAPASVLNFTTCNCRTDRAEPACRNHMCSCKRLGLHCLPACGNCHGLDCNNAQSQSLPDDDGEFEEDENVVETLDD